MKTKLLTLIGLAAMLGTAFSNEPYPNLVFSPDGHYDIGSPSNNRPGNLYLAGSVFASGPTGASYATTATAAGTTTLTNTSKAMQYFTGSTTQTVVLPVASTMTVGQAFTLENLSSGLVTVESSGSNVVGILAPNTRATARCVVASGTNAASWDWFYEGDNSASGKVETFNNTLTFSGTDGTTFTFPSSSDTVVTLAAAQTLTNKNLTGPVINGPTVTGHETIEGVLATGATGTGNFVFSASPTFTGTVTAPALSVTGTAAGTVNLGDNAVTQLTSNTTAVTSNNPSGVITMFANVTNANSAATAVSFTVNCSAVSAGSVVQLTVDNYSGTLGTNGIPIVTASGITGGAFTINVTNASSNALAGTLKIGYAVE